MTNDPKFAKVNYEMLKKRVEQLEERLCISPCGDDNIDQLEEVISYKNFEIDKLKTEVHNLRQQLKLSYVRCKYFNEKGQSASVCDSYKFWNTCRYCEMNGDKT